ncbi:MAG: glycosyltransferase family 4 protein [Geminicoccaceae bacterium]
MSRIAFYAPLKPAEHPVPSGDRRMARSLMALLASLGHEVETACRLRSYDRTGDARRQARLAGLGTRLAERLGQRYARRPAQVLPACWFTYHVYHKAPDWLGPPIVRQLGIPYVVAEASIARKQAQGPWALGYEASRRAIAAADLVLALTRQDEEGLLAAGVPAARVTRFPPFLDTAPLRAAAAQRDAARARLAAAHGLDPARPWLLAVAMMRADVKAISYHLLAQAMTALAETGFADRDWQLLLAGDGEARPAVEAAFAHLPQARFLGLVPAGELPELHAAADLYAWPACNEAYGMAMLEAQAAGTPVVAGDEAGVPDILAHGETGLLVAPRDPLALAAAVATLLDDPARRHRLGRQAAQRTLAEHDVAVARGRLAQALAGIGIAGSA